MADPICRWRNSSIKQVVEFNSLFPFKPIERITARKNVEQKWSLLGGKDFFTTPYQLAAQMAIYYEDDTCIYPQFDKLISIDEANEYINKWSKKYYAPNPYTKSMQSGQKAVVINNFLVNWVMDHGSQCSFSEALGNMFVDTIGNTDILINLINNFMEVDIINDTISLKEGFTHKRYTDEEVWPNVDVNDKKVFFEYVGNNNISINTGNTSLSDPLQQIFYGAPGTGKSHKIKDNEQVKKAEEKKLVFRTTFHPDSDYSTFVGAYKPTMKPVDDKYKAVAGKDEEITYSFVPQAFLQSYVAAWSNQDENVFLIIEEINRGNCAQIFGDLFQLLDRDENGVSEYKIKADADIRTYLEDVLGKDADGIKDGELCLPKNLYIWATMNTSDQSLFPIDSAFKRRWDWKYVKIKNEHKDWKVDIDIKTKDSAGNETTAKLDWYEFIDKINEIIASMTSSADKQLGYFFCKPKTKDSKEIDAETFVSKVIFYLWNDVFKDYAFEDASLFQYTIEVNGNKETKDLTFPDFYNDDESINTTCLTDFIEKVLSWKKGNEDKE